MTMLSPGSPLPKFALESDSGAPVDDVSLRGTWAVIFVYPKADTPGCTREAVAFTELLPEFKKLGARVLGLSKDKTSALCKFREKHDLSVELVADPELTLHTALGAFGEKVMYGKKVQGVIRSTFLVDPSGVIAHVFPSVKVDGHAEKALEVLRALQGGEGSSHSAKPARAKAARK